MINIKDLKVGQVVWECESGQNARLLVKEPPYKADGGWKCRVETSDGEFELFAHNSYPAYGPRLYDRPVYSYASDIKKFQDDKKSLDEKPTL